MSIWRHWFGNKTVLADEMAPLDETLGGFIATSLASADRWRSIATRRNSGA